MVPVAIWRTLLTVPPFPCPRSFKTSRSSLLRSNLYSIPISSCAVCLAFSLLLPPGICRSLSEGAIVRGAGAARASPFTFLRFSVRTEPMASDISRICARHSGLQDVEGRGGRAAALMAPARERSNVEGWQMMRTQYRESKDTLEQSYRYFVSPCKYTQGCRRGYRNHRQLFGVEILVDGMAFGATSRTWGNARCLVQQRQAL